MDLEFFKKLKNEKEEDLEINNIKENIKIKSKEKITTEEIELANKLDAIEELSVDRFEGNIAVLENRESNEMINIRKEYLPSNIKEGDILKKVNGKYFINKNLTEETSKRIKNKMDNLWK